jgi:hypothetical protein
MFLPFSISHLVIQGQLRPNGREAEFPCHERSHANPLKTDDFVTGDLTFPITWQVDESGSRACCFIPGHALFDTDCLRARELSHGWQGPPCSWRFPREALLPWHLWTRTNDV